MEIPSNSPLWLKTAVGEIGVKEAVGGKHNPQILAYHKATSLRAESDETPWCAAFVNWCLAQCNVKGTNMANARSFLGWGKSLETPKAGCIVVFSSSRGPRSGHVGFYVGENPNGTVRVLGGNQGDQVSVASYPAEKVLAYRWPEGMQ